MAASDVIAGRTAFELQDSGLGPNGAFIRFRDADGNLVSGVDEKGVVQALQGIAFADGSSQSKAAPVTNGSNQLVVPSGGLVYPDSTVQTTGYTTGSYPRKGVTFWGILQTTGIGNAAGSGPATGLVSQSGGGSTLGFSPSVTVRTGLATHNYDLPANFNYFNAPANTTTGSSGLLQLNGSTNLNTKFPFYIEIKMNVNTGTSATNRTYIGMSDSWISFQSAPVGIPVALTNNFIGFRFVNGGSGTKDTNWMACAWNAANHAPGTVVDTQVAPDFTQPHTFVISSDGTTITYYIDGVSVGTILVSNANVPLAAVSFGPGFAVDNNATANADTNNPNAGILKYIYADSTIPQAVTVTASGK